MASNSKGDTAVEVTKAAQTSKSLHRLADHLVRMSFEVEVAVEIHSEVLDDRRRGKGERVRDDQRGGDIRSLIVNVKMNESALVKVVKQAKFLPTLYAILEALSQATVSKASGLSQLQRSIIIHIRDIHLPKISGGLQHRLTKDKEQNRRHGGTLRYSRKEGLRRLSFAVK